LRLSQNYGLPWLLQHESGYVSQDAPWLPGFVLDNQSLAFPAVWSRVTSGRGAYLFRYWPSLESNSSRRL